MSHNRLRLKGPLRWAEAYGKPYPMSFNAARLGGCSDSGERRPQTGKIFFGGTKLVEKKETTRRNLENQATVCIRSVGVLMGTTTFVAPGWSRYRDFMRNGRPTSPPPRTPRLALPSWLERLRPPETRPGRGSRVPTTAKPSNRDRHAVRTTTILPLSITHPEDVRLPASASHWSHLALLVEVGCLV